MVAAKKEAGINNELTLIAVGGYKCFRDLCALPIGRLTLFCGWNFSGKSSFLQPRVAACRGALATAQAPPRLRPAAGAPPRGGG